MHARPWSRLLPAALATAVALGAATVPVAAAATPGAAAGAAAGERSAVQSSPSGRYLVQYARQADVAAEARSLRSEGVRVRRTFGRSIKAAVVTATRAEAAELAQDPSVLAVEPDVRISTADTQSNAPWGLDRMDQTALPLTASYTAPSSGKGVTVYVVDTGVLASHQDFGGRVESGWSAIEDGRGTGDCNGHGTHVAGTVAGSFFGVAKSATIVPVRVLDCAGAGSGSDLLAALDWIVRDHAAGTPAVLNMSLGSDSVSSAVDAAVRGVIADGVTAVVAAGNDTRDACTSSPASVSEALTVAASDRYDQQTSFSNYGPCVDLYAPGQGIESAWHSSTTATKLASGTSMATPHVAGAAAVLLAQRPDLSPAEVAARLNADATANVVRNVTGGTPNRLLHLTAAAAGESDLVADEPTVELTKPARAAKPRAGAKRRSATVTWVQGDDGGSPLTKQVVRVYQGTKRVGAFRVPADITGVRVTGLRPGKVYRFTVIEKNALGTSPESAKSNKVRPRR